MNPPSQAAMRAAEAIQEMFTPGYSMPSVEDAMAAIIDRETGAGEALELIERLVRWQNFTNSEFGLHCGEMTAQELRTVKAVINAIAGDEARAFLEKHKP